MGKEKWKSLIWLGIGVLICVGSLRLSLGTFRNPGAGFFPFLSGVFLILLAVVSYSQARRNSKSDSPGTSFWHNRSRGIKVVLTVCALLAYALTLEHVGFATTTFAFLVFLLLIVEPHRWFVAIGWSLLISGGAYSIFELMLHSQLPKGPWQFF
jgi:putative tricarboxylic transport membrane protein